MIGFLRYRLNLKLFASFLLIILVTALSSLLIGYQVIGRTAEREIRIRLGTSMEAYLQEVRILEENCQRIAGELAGEGEIARLLAGGKFKELERKLVHYHRMKVFDIVEIEDAAGKVLVRGHQPAEAGDLKIDQVIVRQGLSGSGAVSYEGGRSGLAIRAVAPVRSGDLIIGLVMVGSQFSTELSGHIKRLTGMDNGVYLGAEKLISTYLGYERLPEGVVRRLRGRKPVFVDSAPLDGEAAYLLLQPLFLPDGTFWGALSLGLGEREEGRYLRYSQEQFLLSVGIGVGLALVVFLVLARNINGSLAKILAGMDGFNLNRFNTRIELSSRDEFQMIAESFNQLTGKLSRYHRRIEKLQEDMIKAAKLATAGQMAAGLAHEIRNPLSSIKMMAQIIRSRYLGEQGQKELGMILEEIDRINHLVRELLEFARPSPLHFVRQDANRIITGVLDLFRHHIDHQKIEVEARLDLQMPDPVLDGEKFRLAVMNLVLNAIQAMPEGGRLEVESRVLPGQRVLFRFCSGVPPIPPASWKAHFRALLHHQEGGHRPGSGAVPGHRRAAFRPDPGGQWRRPDLLHDPLAPESAGTELDILTGSASRGNDPGRR